MSLNLSSVGNLVKTERQRRELSVQELANRLGVSRMTISRIEGNQEMKIDVVTLIRISNQLSIDFFDMIFRLQKEKLDTLDIEKVIRCTRRMKIGETIVERDELIEKLKEFKE